ncbi:MAG: hypothetical protein M3276_07965 [Actinomycetota bacterium]|nr:hypothetical protein [Actinomycetota bacterium]
MRPHARLHSQESGLAGQVLVLIIAWALAAVLMLTATLVSAQRIDEDVAVITGEVIEIDDELDMVRRLESINASADGILVAARPLSGQLNEVNQSAGSIDRNVVAILDTARQINGTAKEINGTAKTINGTVTSINGTATSINATVRSIHGNVGAILGTARSINDGVAAINRRVDVVIAAVTGIKGDTGNILAQVGPGHDFAGGGASIHGHANSIDCSPVVRPLSQHCGQ